MNKNVQNYIKDFINTNSNSIFITHTKRNGKNFPFFVYKPELVELACYDNECTYNLAVYLTKPEIKKFSTIGILANFYTLKALLQLYAENQLDDRLIRVVTINEQNELVELKNIEEIEQYIKSNTPPKKENLKVKEILNLSKEERWKFWNDELSKCIKCYACRAVCPLCYCTKCTIEINQPQWIEVPAHSLGNFEWHIMRAMHLAGRCIECNNCVNACPMDIPLNLLTIQLNNIIEQEFNQVPGTSKTLNYALSTFKTEDKENFIR